MLVVLLPLTGCLDLIDPANADDDSDADSHTHSVNNPPVIYGSLRFSDYYDYDTSTLHEDVLVFEGMVQDIDGIVVQFGVDTDLDGVIDYYMPRASGFDEWNQPLLLMITDNTSWWNPIPSAQGDVEYCEQWIQLIAVDVEGAMQINPSRAIFEFDDETDLCLLERN